MGTNVREKWAECVCSVQAWRGSDTWKRNQDRGLNQPTPDGRNRKRLIWQGCTHTHEDSAAGQQGPSLVPGLSQTNQVNTPSSYVRSLSISLHYPQTSESYFLYVFPNKTEGYVYGLRAAAAARKHNPQLHTIPTI
jgi:hypothetical protein